MYVGAALGAIGLVVGLFSTSSIRHSIEKKYPNYSASKVNTVVHAEVAFIIILGLIGIGLWIWIAQKLKAGRQWARVTGTVFFGLDTLALLGSLATGTGAASKVFSVIAWIVGLVIVILIWRSESSAYFKPRPQPQSAW
jgi:uncharacterized membrane protein YiaA